MIAAEQYAYCSGGKINFWFHLGEERPEKSHNFIRLLSAVALNRPKAAEECHFTGESIGDQPQSFANYDLLLFVPSTRFHNL